MLRICGMLAVMALTSSAVLAQTPESEPNDNPATATAGVRGGRGTGTIEWGRVEDNDYWVLTVSAGETIFADIDANEFGIGVDPSLELYAADGTTRLARSAAWDGLDPHITYVATTSGPYYIKVYATYQNSPGPSPYTINFFEIKCPTAQEVEPNDSPASATSVAVGSSTRGVVCPADDLDRPGDQDFFKFNVTAGTKLELQVDTVGRERPPFGCACNIVAFLRLVASDGTTSLAQTSENDFPKRIQYDVTTTGTYYAQISMFPGGIRYPYTLHVRSLNAPADPITVAKAVGDLLRPGTGLTAEQRTELDSRGNQNGRYDVGDLRAYLMSTGTLAAPTPMRIPTPGVKP